MAIDFLGKEHPKKNIKAPEKIILHQPLKEKKEVKPVPAKPVVIKKIAQVAVSKEELGEVNLIVAFKRYLLKKRLLLALICFVVIVTVGLAGAYLVTRPPKIVVNTNLNQSVNVSINQAPAPVCGNALTESGEQCDGTGCTSDQICVDCLCQTITPPAPVCGNALIESGEQCDVTGCTTDQNCINCLCQTVTPPAPVCGNFLLESGEQCDFSGCNSDQTCIDCQCQLTVLPDTDLAPLRGALVKFSGSANIYLIEWHGELRLVDLQTAVFKGGLTIKALQNQIYAINSRYQNTRQGDEVKGYVDWDPRILTNEELEIFK
jgi:hypothetical protein